MEENESSITSAGLVKQNGNVLRRNILKSLIQTNLKHSILGSMARRSCSITNALLNNYTNVQIVREHIFKHLKGTPLENLVNRIHLNGTQLSVQHKSDMLRVALLWRRGGIYLDHDTVVLRPLTGLRNAIGMSNGTA